MFMGGEQGAWRWRLLGTLGRLDSPPKAGMEKPPAPNAGALDAPDPAPNIALAFALEGCRAHLKGSCVCATEKRARSRKASAFSFFDFFTSNEP